MKLRELCCWWRRAPAAAAGGGGDGDAASSAASAWLASSDGTGASTLDAALLAHDYAAREGVIDARDVELLGKIGEGACGIVRRARVGGRDAAVKCVDLRRHGRDGAAAALRDVLREALLKPLLKPPAARPRLRLRDREAEVPIALLERAGL